jgi:4'-phosphopantetheinyl transferase
VERVDIWIVHEHAPAVQARFAAYASLLSDDENRRAARIAHPGARRHFVIGRALARTMLSRYGTLPPREWPIVIDRHGRPMLDAQPHTVPDLRFNLTHCEGLIACGVTIGRELGIDAENVTRRLLHDGVPERFFAPREVADLRALPAHHQPLAFFEYWTLKEAYLKARGLGLALPLARFAFVFDQDTAPRVEFDPDLGDDPATWQFARFRPTPMHRLAVAVRRSGPDLPIEVRDVVPDVS